MFTPSLPDSFHVAQTQRTGPRLCRGLLWAALLCLALLRPVQAATVTEFPTGDRPYGITPGPDGNLSAVEQFGSRVLRITPSGQITPFSLPVGEGPIGITVGPDGNGGQALWVAGFTAVLRVTTSGQTRSTAAAGARNPSPWARTATPASSGSAAMKASRSGSSARTAT